MDKLTARKCALCGKSTSNAGQGAINAATMLVKYAKEAGIPLKAPDHDYLHIGTCARKLSTRLRKTLK